MKEGFVVKNAYLYKSSNCVIVDNYFIPNIVLNIPIDIKEIEKYKDQDSIGVWRIKSLKN